MIKNVKELFSPNSFKVEKPKSQILPTGKNFSIPANQNSLLFLITFV